MKTIAIISTLFLAGIGLAAAAQDSATVPQLIVFEKTWFGGEHGHFFASAPDLIISDGRYWKWSNLIDCSYFWKLDVPCRSCGCRRGGESICYARTWGLSRCDERAHTRQFYLANPFRIVSKRQRSLSEGGFSPARIYLFKLDSKLMLILLPTLALWQTQSPT